MKERRWTRHALLMEEKAMMRNTARLALIEALCIFLGGTVFVIIGYYAGAW